MLITRLFTLLLLSLSFVLSVYPQPNLAPSNAPSDEIAYTALFHVVRAAPAPHWDTANCEAWLEKRGLIGGEATIIITAATAYYARQQVAELALARINQENVGRLLSDAAEAQRVAVRKQLSADVADAATSISR
ncbi:MAG: hypothetical protein NTV52_35165, partial [Acidobacteria bacterium]|nr:hypothetical protein [Acidobacteriota bacterium]